MARTIKVEAGWKTRGTDGRTFPWGEVTAVCDLAAMDDGSGSGCGTNAAVPAGSKSPAGDSPFGATDMAGNVWDCQ